MVNGIIDRFNVHSVLMLTYLQPRDVTTKPDRSRDEQDICSFNSILERQFNTVKGITKS